MFDYPAMRAVKAVAETGSFEKAALALNVTASAISQRVKQLEERLGAVLIVRGQPCRATETGEWLCRHMDNVAMLEQELTARLPGLASPEEAEKRVTLTIATNADSLGTWLLPALSSFSNDPRYLLNVVVDGEDHTVEWLEKGRVLAAVTSLEKPATGCRKLPLGTMRYHAVASPTYMKRHFNHGVTAQNLGTAPAITFNRKDRLQHRWAKLAFGQDLEFPTHWLPSTQGFLDAALLGMGWCLNPAFLARDHIAAGRLVELMPGTVLDVPLTWQINRLAADRLTGLTEAVLEAAKRGLG